MEPVKTHDAVLPQQKLTRSAGGCPSGPRPGDLVREGQEGANPLVGRRVANADIFQPPGVPALLLGDVERKSATRLDIYKLLVAAAKSYGTKTRPMDLDITERIDIIINFLYPNGVPNGICLHSNRLKDIVMKFTHKCEKLYLQCRRNMPFFCKKYHAWLSHPFEIIFSDQLTAIPTQEVIMEQDQLTEDPTQKEVFKEQDQLTDSNISRDVIMERDQLTGNNIPKEVYVEQDQKMSQMHGNYPNIPSSVIDNSLSAPSTSGYKQGESERQKRRVLKNIEQLLKDQPSSKIIKLASKTVTDDGGTKLSKNIAHEFEFVAKECLKSPTRAKKIANLIRSESETKPLSPEDALSMIIEKKLTVDDYTSMQQDLKQRGFKPFPPYYKVQAAKKLCHPEEDVIVKEKEASVSLFSLLLHTFRRIVQSNDSIITAYCKEHNKDTIQCRLEGSWGFDGTTGQSAYKQKFANSNDDEHCLFATTFIPLILKTSDGFVLWSNPILSLLKPTEPVTTMLVTENDENITLCSDEILIRSDEEE
ncbi:uncharacterized protein [Choristoneura fumiferana]|uniref:uncharacterized protein n=1 Tax=Choristoneura fumiferana TaxID=7141 RepID=UPI003D15382A